MTVSGTNIAPHDKHENWFVLKLISRKDSIGESRSENLISEEALRMLRLQIDNALEARKAGK